MKAMCFIGILLMGAVSSSPTQKIRTIKLEEKQQQANFKGTWNWMGNESSNSI